LEDLSIVSRWWPLGRTLIRWRDVA
jgi:hypothetical protein